MPRGHWVCAYALSRVCTNQIIKSDPFPPGSVDRAREDKTSDR
jgi:hypothetical protein